MALTLNDLNTRCASFQTAYYRYYPELREYFRLLELSGCRTTEPLLLDRWTYVNATTLTLLPLKGNSTRVVNVGASCPNFVEDVRIRRKPFRGRTLENVYRTFDDTRCFRNCKSQDKPVSVYLFRYRYIKSLFAAGMSVPQVAAHMGYQSTDTPNFYLQAELVEDSIDLPPYTCRIGNQIWSTRNYDTSDPSSLISHYSMLPRNVAGAYFDPVFFSTLKTRLNGCRIPTRDDILELNDFVRSDGHFVYELANPSNLRFIQFDNHAKNLYGFNAIGSNDSSTVGVGWRPAFLRLWLDYKVGSIWYNTRININSESISVFSINQSVRAPIRLIYNQLVV